MITTFLCVFAFFIVMVSAMAIGAIVKNKPIKGTCGGLSSLGLKDKCDICGGKPHSGETPQLLVEYYDATKPRSH